MNFWIDCGAWFFLFEWNGRLYIFDVRLMELRGLDDGSLRDYRHWIDIDVPEELWNILDEYFSDPLFELELLRC